MSDLLKRFENLTINSSDDGRNVLQDYVCKVKSEKKYFDCQNNFLVIPEQVGSKFVLCERKYIEGQSYVVCYGCRNLVSHENIKNINNTLKIKESYCINSKICEILFQPSQKEKRLGGFTEILLDDKKLKISLVHPSEEHNKIPGIVIVNARTSKPKCHMCKGFKCLHLNILNMKKVDGVIEKSPPPKRVGLKHLLFNVWVKFSRDNVCHIQLLSLRNWDSSIFH